MLLLQSKSKTNTLDYGAERGIKRGIDSLNSFAFG
jgi:hypothetical protein